IETATTVVGVALVAMQADGDSAVLGSVEIHHGRRHAEVLAPAIDFVCEHAQVSLDTIGGVVVDRGPGLFTGMRVGIATASALGFALDVPVVGVSSLDVLAAGGIPPTRASGDDETEDPVVAAVIDARKGEVFFRLYRRGVALGDATTGSIADFNAAVMARGQRVIAVGDGAWRYRDELAGDVVAAPLAHPSAVVAARVGRAALVAADLDGTRPTVQPLYLRAPDAQINWTQRSSGDR
ncbi:MAG TPA: tRNA (adenosine(37)-N6)-threonylcarbamoyltransferase complex dimerization subunit type 1 TsaB, partial [Ilumatobacteraceae bacterium]|nr:tRNA (adenosine(37)-N6)-threonylcarbamoyltransferase complex dimerization subunit type 1 TsaB [Ilumatobacteraceae bacterium]